MEPAPRVFRAPHLYVAEPGLDAHDEVRDETVGRVVSDQTTDLGTKGQSFDPGDHDELVSLSEMPAFLKVCGTVAA